MKNLPVKIIEINVYQDKVKWKHNLKPVEISENKSGKVIDLLTYKNHYALIKKLNIFLGNHNKNFASRWRLNSYKNENALMDQKQKC